MDTTVKVTDETRDRLAVLAADEGKTVKDFLADVAATRLTHAERQQRLRDATDQIRRTLDSTLGEDGMGYGDWLWGELKAGRVPERLPTVEEFDAGQRPGSNA